MNEFRNTKCLNADWYLSSTECKGFIHSQESQIEEERHNQESRYCSWNTNPIYSIIRTKDPNHFEPSLPMQQISICPMLLINGRVTRICSVWHFSFFWENTKIQRDEEYIKVLNILLGSVKSAYTTISQNSRQDTILFQLHVKNMWSFHEASENGKIEKKGEEGDGAIWSRARKKGLCEISP
jgi:hypothetical protein